MTDLARSRRQFGWTALHVATRHDKHEAIELLVSLKANLSARTRVRRCVEDVCLSVRHTTDTVRPWPQSGWTPLHIAVIYDKEESIEVLVSLKANLETRDYVRHGR